MAPCAMVHSWMMRSISPVVMPGRTCGPIMSRHSAARRPARCMPRKSSGRWIGMRRLSPGDCSIGSKMLWARVRRKRRMAPAVGFEPTTNGLTVRCATAAPRRISRGRGIITACHGPQVRGGAMQHQTGRAQSIGPRKRMLSGATLSHPAARRPAPPIRPVRPARLIRGVSQAAGGRARRLSARVRSEAESNRPRGICSPVPNQSAIGPWAAYIGPVGGMVKPLPAPL